MSGKVAAFHELHRAGCFIMPNAWDAGSAVYLQKLGFKAIASTSAGFAWTLGRPDNRVTLEQVLAHLAALSVAVTIPVNADFEDAFAVSPEDVAVNVTRAAATGIAGLSVEDSTRDGSEPLYPFELALQRVRAARQAIDASGTGVLLTARSEGFIAGRPDLAETIRRLKAFAEAGADCLFAPGIRGKDIAAVAGAVAPKPVNLIAGPYITSAEAAAIGVRRLSVGGSLARAAWRGLDAAAREMAEHGTFSSLAGAPLDLNAAFE